MRAREVDGYGLESDLLVNYRTSITNCLPQSDIDMLYILCLAHEYTPSSVTAIVTNTQCILRIYYYYYYNNNNNKNRH